MIRYFFLVLTALCTTYSFGQELTGAQLLEKAINYHDPQGNWETFNGELHITMNIPEQKERISVIRLNLPEEYFQLTATKEENTTTQTLIKGTCELLLNGNNDIKEEELKKHRLTCERATMYQNYYTYLYGLPMKLKDPGTIIDSKTHKKTFKGKEYLVLKATYKQDVGDDIWYFYFDPTTYAMEVYQFFHDESINDGEYILLSGAEEVSGIKMPKARAWYYNKDDAYLATDVLTKATALEK